MDCIRQVLTEDGARLAEGDRAFNYYDMAWGTIGPIGTDGWFTFTNDVGARCLLNGARIATFDPRER